MNYRMATPAGRAALLFVSLLTLVMVALLYRTQSHAAGIRDKTAAIAASSSGINDYTDSIMHLDRTNELAAAIAVSVQPLQSSLASISDSSAQIARGLDSIGSSAESIEDSARLIDTHAGDIREDVDTVANQVGRINTSLDGINANAASILSTAEAIEHGIGLISSNLAGTNSVVQLILGDAKGINTRLVRTNHLAACIDNGLNGNAPC